MAKSKRPGKHQGEPVPREVPDLSGDLLQELRRIVPSAFSDGKVDTQKLQNLLGQGGPATSERFTFTWAGRQDSARLLQFPTRATLFAKEELSVNVQATRNLFIEGDNLEVLKILYKPFFGRIKMIYIDPPYNTGNDFVYPDNYADPLASYLQLTGQADSEGNLQTSNPETSGRFHSTWLSMMFPRLFIARPLLTEDGSIFVSIDDTEAANLRLLLNEVFGEENFLANIVWQKKYGPANDATGISQTHEHILCYAKNAEAWRPKLFPRTKEQLEDYDNPDDDLRGIWRASDLSARTASENCIYPIKTPSGRVVYPPKSRSWIMTKDRYEELLADNRIWFGSSGNGRPMQKKFLNEVKEGITPETWWSRDVAGDNKSARYEIKKLFPENVYDTPKPTKLIKRLIFLATDKNDTILDFFAGSGTTGDAVLQQNEEDGGGRNFILVQVPEPTPEGSPARKAGFNTVSQIGAERIRLVIKDLRHKRRQRLPKSPETTPEDLGFRFLSLGESNLRPWSGVEERSSPSWGRAMQKQVDPLVVGWEPDDVILEVALKEGLTPDLTIDRRKDLLDNTVFTVKDGITERQLTICLDEKVKSSTIRSLGLRKEDMFVCKDVALDDTSAANLALQCHLLTL